MKLKTKIFAVVSFLLILIVGGAVFYYYFILPGQLTRLFEQKLLEQLNTNDQDLYTVKTETIQLRLSTPQIRIPHISIQPKEHIFSDTLPQNLPSFLLRVTLQDFSISANGIIAALRNRKDIIFNQAGVSVTDVTLFGNSESTAQNKEPNSIMAEENYGINDLDLRVERFTYKLLADTTVINFIAHGLHFKGSLLNTANIEETKRDWCANHYALKVASLNYFPEGELYSYHTQNLDVSSDDQVLSLLSTAIKPKYGKKEFQRHLEYQTDRMDVSIDTITLSGFDPNALINENTMILSGIGIQNARIGVFRDRNLPFDTLHRPLMPVKLMHSSPVLFMVPKIDLHNVDVIYSELPENGTNEGIVPITNIDATIRNFTNIADSLQNDSIMQIEAEGRFFQQAGLKAAFDYNMQDMNGGYDARGELSELDFTKLNDVLMPLLKIEAESGVHSHTTFAFSGNDIQSTGKITMIYSDLNLVMEPDRSQLRQSVVGWAVRNLVYHPSNPVENGDIRENAIGFQRDKTRFVFHYWWNCYLSGIKNTVLRDHISSFVE